MRCFITVLSGLMLLVVGGCSVYYPAYSDNVVVIKNDVAGTILEPHVNGGAFRARNDPERRPIRIPYPDDRRLDFGWEASGVSGNIDIYVYDAKSNEYLGNAMIPYNFPYYNQSYGYNQYQQNHQVQTYDIRSYSPPAKIMRSN